jgi:hypothetical protein
MACDGDVATNTRATTILEITHATVRYGASPPVRTMKRGLFMGLAGRLRGDVASGPAP